MALTEKQRLFVAEYLIDLNATAAYKRAGYTGKGNTAEVNAARMLRNAQVKAEIAKAMQAREERTHITQDRVLQELARIAFFDIRRLYNEHGGLKAPHELDDDAAAVLSGIDITEEFAGRGEEREHVGYTKKAKVFDKGAAIALAMRHLGMLKDKTELSGPGGAPVLPPVINLIRSA